MRHDKNLTRIERLRTTRIWRPFPMVGDPPGIDKMTKKQKEHALYEQAMAAKK